MNHAAILSTSLCLLIAVVTGGPPTADPNKVLSLIIKDLQDAGDGPAGEKLNDRACDGLLTHINNEIIRQNTSIIPLPDIKEVAEWKGMKVNVFATKGRAGNLATLKRLSSTSVRKSNGGKKIEVGVVVGLGSLSLQYQEYKSDISGAKNKGQIEVFVKKHAAMFKVTVVLNGNQCSITLNKFKITELEGVTPVIEPNNVYLSSYLAWYLENKKGERLAELEKKLVEMGQKALNDFKCKLQLPQ